MNLNNLKLKLDLKNKIIVNLIIILIFALGIIYFLIIPTISDIKKMESEIDAQRIDLEKKYKKGQSLRKLTENIKKIEPSLSTFDQVFINQGRALEFVTTMEGIANQHGISQRLNLMTDKSAQINGYTKTPLGIMVGGDFQSITDYISSIEALNYYININSIQISKNSDSSGTSTVTVQILADTYWK